MGRQRGLVHLSGRFGDTLMTIDGQKGVAKMQTFLSKERIMNDPKLHLIRKNMSEFGGASQAVDMLMACFGENGASFGERYLRGKLQKLAKKVMLNGPGPKGRRSFEVVANAAMLNGLNLNKGDKFRKRFMPMVSVTVNPDRNTATLDVPSFFPDTRVKTPTGAKEFRLCLSVGALSDFVFDGSLGVYKPANPDLLGRENVIYSAFMDCAGSLNPGFQLVASLNGLPLLPSTAGLVVSVGIEFFATVGSVPDLFAQGNAMCILGVY